MKSLFTLLGVLLAPLLSGQHYSGMNDELEDADSEIVRVFVLAGQSNMQGHGKIYEGSNGAVGVVIASFIPDCLDDETAYCDFTFEMFDGYGDGWNGWTYDFVQNGNVVATETLENGSEGSAFVSLQNGVTCDIVVNSAGGYGNEVSWELISPSDDVVASMVGAEDDYPAPNTLLDVIENDEEGYWSMLQTDGEWSVFEGTHLYFENGDGTVIQDHVTIGQGAYPDLIGPELMFAVQMDQFYDDPVLIIKTAWGGLSLAEDFRPPSAGGNTGFYYNEMIDRVAYVTENMQALFPDIGTDQFEITGFGWFQGWNDAGSDDFLNEYESNLHHLVNDVRIDLGNPELPFVIASSGQGGYEDHWGWTQDIQDIIAVAQEAVGCDDETYGGTVGFVDTKPLYIAASESPDDAGFHFHNNARTFLNVGKFMGDEMILAIGDMAFCSEVSVDETNLSMNEASIYPNPASNEITIDLSEMNQGNARMKCYDLNGKVMVDQLILTIGSIDVSSFAEGMYIIELESSEGVYRERILVR